jgi:hypothetical protein
MDRGGGREDEIGASAFPPEWVLIEKPGVPPLGMPGLLFQRANIFRAGAALPIYTDKWIHDSFFRKGSRKGRKEKNAESAEKN